MFRIFFVIVAVWLCLPSAANAQCPPNIGFEKGNFDNWELYAGKVDQRTGELTLNPTTWAIYSDNFVVIDNELSSKAKGEDEYGGFPNFSPNNSKYSVRMAIAAGGSDAFSLQYTFKVPDTQLEDYSIIYHYAVVLENPQHEAHLQPQFTVKVFNVTDNEYVDCGAFQFIASSNLPGFLESPHKTAVFYKKWAPITLKLPGFANKTLRLEFTVNDCGPGGHFGYAYLDINENCTTPITGNVFCGDGSNVRLTAPYGFQGYKWFSSDFSQQLGNENILQLRPAPAEGTVLALEITPFPNQGCLDTLYTTIGKSNEPFEFKLQTRIEGCERPGIDITTTALITGSTPGLQYSYFTDQQELNYVADPKAVDRSGMYYIKAENSAGCTDTHPLQVYIQATPTLDITPPAPECIPNTANLLDPQVLANNPPGRTYSYWLDDKLSKPVTEDLTRINKSATYYIKVTDNLGCTNKASVHVSVTPPPVVVITDYQGCGLLEMQKMNPTAGSDPDATASFWFDATASTQEIPFNHVFFNTTDYFVKMTSIAGCSVIEKANVVIYPLPSYTVTQPTAVTIPVTVDITKTVPRSTEWTYSYWEDSATTKALMFPERVLESGKYFVKATTPVGCSVTQPILVNIGDAPIVPPNAFSPNGDGINDVWIIPLLEYYPKAIIEVFNRTGQSVYKNVGYSKYWDGKSNNGKTLPTGVYYYIIKAAPHLKPISGSLTILY